MIVDKVVIYKGDEVLEIEKENLQFEFVLQPSIKEDKDNSESYKKMKIDSIEKELIIRWKENK